MKLGILQKGAPARIGAGDRSGSRGGISRVQQSHARLPALGGAILPADAVDNLKLLIQATIRVNVQHLKLRGYPTDSLAFGRLAQELSCLSHPERKQLLQSCLEVFKFQTALSADGASLLSKVLTQCTAAEKVEVLRWVKKESLNGTLKDQLAREILLSCGDRAELITVLGSAKRTLGALAGTRVGAIAGFLRAQEIISATRHPDLSRGDPREALAGYLRVLSTRLERARGEIGETAAGRFGCILRRNLELLDNGEKLPLDQASGQRFLGKVALELHFGIILSERQGRTLWTTERANELRAVLEFFPINEIISLPPFIFRLASQKTLHLGVFSPNGRVAFLEPAVRSHVAIACEVHKNSRWSPFQRAILHELSHAPNKPEESLRFSRPHNQKKEQMLSGMNPRSDFGCFLALSDWQLYDSRFGDQVRQLPKRDDREPMYYINGHTLNIHNEHRGTAGRRIFSKSGDNLLSFSPYTEFVADPDARKDFRRDWGESLKEYLLAPRRMIKQAPLKFLHLEYRFKRYGADPHLIGFLNRTLRARSPQQLEFIRVRSSAARQR